jgi:hypothetical protein
MSRFYVLYLLVLEILYSLCSNAFEKVDLYLKFKICAIF